MEFLILVYIWKVRLRRESEGLMRHTCALRSGKGVVKHYEGGRVEIVGSQA